MASAWVEKRATSKAAAKQDGTAKPDRFCVRYRLGGREVPPLWAGSFRTQREAEKRRDWVLDQLAQLRVPDLNLIMPAAPAPTLREVAERWRVSRIDVSAATAQTHRVNLGRILPALGHMPIDAITAEDVASFVVAISDLKRETIRKTIATMSMVFEYHGVMPNPAKDKRVKLPQEDKLEVNPPTAPHVVAVHGLLPSAYRLPLLVLDATGMRVSELEQLAWGDVDEQEGRWRVSQANAKTKQARWVPVPEIVFQAVVDTVPREDRAIDGQVFAGFGSDRFRTAITRACKASGVPAFSPHDLRHRRATLWHLQGVPAAEASGWLGHSAQEHLRTYAHVVIDRTEVNYADVLGSDRLVHT